MILYNKISKYRFVISGNIDYGENSLNIHPK